MNKIIRKHYPASKLTKDLRGNISPDAHVAVVIEEEPEEQVSMEVLRSKISNLPHSTATIRDAVSRIRELRNEWDD
jgi:hypothetical protein